MKTEKIKELIEILDKSSLNKLQLKDGESEIVLEKGAPIPQVVSYQNAPAPTMHAPVAPHPPVAEAVKSEAPSREQSNHTRVVAPLVGIYYEASSPESAPYVTVGSRVKAGDILCIIEAMKVLNEIKAPVAGEIKAIHVKNGDVLSYDQLLIEIGE